MSGRVSPYSVLVYALVPCLLLYGVHTLQRGRPASSQQLDGLSSTAYLNRNLDLGTAGTGITTANRRMEPAAKKAKTARRIGIVGYGKLGQFLVKAIQERPALNLELAFVWNRNSQKVTDAGLGDFLLEDLTQFASKNPDLIIEVAHPSITKQYGEAFLAVCDYMVGSPTAFADAAVEAMARKAADADGGGGMYIPSGALWGAVDLQKMDQSGSLKALTVTMKKHPGSFKLQGELVAINEKALTSGNKEDVLYEGPVRALCPLAPNNVNTMAAACLAASSLGFDKVIGRLVADSTLEAHVIVINAVGPGEPPFTVDTVRYNPSKPGAVTGNATYESFVSSMIRAAGHGIGVHFC